MGKNINSANRKKQDSATKNGMASKIEKVKSPITEERRSIQEMSQGASRDWRCWVCCRNSRERSTLPRETH
jgi:hypothetical protein